MLFNAIIRAKPYLPLHDVEYKKLLTATQVLHGCLQNVSCDVRLIPPTFAILSIGYITSAVYSIRIDF